MESAGEDSFLGERFSRALEQCRAGQGPVPDLLKAATICFSCDNEAVVVARVAMVTWLWLMLMCLLWVLYLSPLLPWSMLTLSYSDARKVSQARTGEDRVCRA